MKTQQVEKKSRHFLKKDIFNKKFDRKKNWLNMEKDEDSIEKIQILFIQILFTNQRLFLGFSELPLTLLQQHVRQRCKVVHSNK